MFNISKFIFRRNIVENLYTGRSPEKLINIVQIEFLILLINYFTETLRLHPPVHSMNRICTKPYKIPGEDIIIEKDTSVFITLTGIHRDPEYYERPNEFYPDHFSDENIKQRHPFAYMPFGKGPRECIGKFLKMSIKM